MPALAPDIFSGKRLVVFGAGYVGGAVAREAVKRGVRVTALTRNPDQAARLIADGIEVVTAELASESWHGQISGRVDYVLNCVSSGGAGVESYRRSYVEGMRSILSWAAAVGGVATLVYTSSTSVYPQSGGARVDESASTLAASGSGTAGVLLEAEAILKGVSPDAVRRWFILRLAGIYGPARHHLLDQLRAGSTEIGGQGEHRLNLIHRDDSVAAVLAAFSAASLIKNEIFNVCDDSAVPKAELCGWLAGQLGCTVPIFTGSPTVGRRAVTPDRVIANDKIKRVLGWFPRYTDFRAGYKAILEA